MHRFFVPSSAIDKGMVTLSGALVHQVAKVLRLVPGDRVLLLDNSGWCYEVELDRLEERRLTGVVRDKTLVTTEPRTKLTIYQGLLRAHRFEYVLQKGTEIGVVAFVPTLCERCIVEYIGAASRTKLERWQKIIVEAAEQSRRGKLPLLRPAVLFQQACAEVRGLSLIAWEDETAPSLRTVLRQAVAKGGRPFSLNLFVGPEGGFAPAEVEQARSYGILPVGLGPRILRAETAAAVASALILSELGDMEESQQVAPLPRR